MARRTRRSNPVTDGVDLQSAAIGAAIGAGLAWLLKPVLTGPAQGVKPGGLIVGTIGGPSFGQSVLGELSIGSMSPQRTVYREGVRYTDAGNVMEYYMANGVVYMRYLNSPYWQNVTGTSMDPTQPAPVVQTVAVVERQQPMWATNQWYNGYGFNYPRFRRGSTHGSGGHGGGGHGGP